MEIISIVVLVFFVLIAALLVLMVLIQDEQGDGLAGMFGGGSSTTFGSRAGNVLTRTTSVLGALFLLIAFSLAIMYKTQNTGDVAAAARKAQSTNQEWWSAAPSTPATAPTQSSVTPAATSAAEKAPSSASATQPVPAPATPSDKKTGQ